MKKKKKRTTIKFLPTHALMHVRKNLTYLLLNLPIDKEQTSVKALLLILDHFHEYPEDYLELVNAYHDHKRTQTEETNHEPNKCL